MAEGRGQRDRDAPFFRRPAQRGEGEALPRSQHQDRLLKEAEKRLAAANAAIGTTRTFFFALLSIAAYIGVVVWGTTDEQLLRISPVKLPIVGVEVPLTGFYAAVPWLFVLLHFNLLIHVGLTGKKLKAFLDRLVDLDQATADGLRSDVANFPLAQWMAGRHDLLFRSVLAILAWITLVLIPPFLVLWMQLRFLPYQDERLTWLQAAAVATDVLLIVGFRAWFVRHVQPETSWLAGWKTLGRDADNGLAIAFRLTASQPLFRYLVPLIPLGLAAFLAVGLSELLHAEKVLPCPDEGDAPEYRRWLCAQYRLDVHERLIARNTPPPSVANALHSDDAEARKKALGETLGIDLQARYLRGANLYRTQLPNSDLRGAHLEGANLWWARLEGTDLFRARLEGANLYRARLEGADLRDPWLAGANLRRARLEGANLRGWGTEWDMLLAGMGQFGVQPPRLAGAELRTADLAWADLTYADLAFADLSDVENLDTAELAGADYVFADGLEGTFLDINQPPPDVLPAP